MVSNKTTKDLIFGSYNGKNSRLVDNTTVLRGEEHEITIYKNGQYEKAVGLRRPHKAPKILSFEDNYAQTLDFLATLRHESISNHANKASHMEYMRKCWKRIQAPVMLHYYDFEPIKQITASVALMIASEYNSANETGAYLPGAVNIGRWNTNVRKLLDEIGFLSMSGVESDVDAIREGEGWKVVRFRSDTQTDGKLIYQFLDDLGIAELGIGTEIYDGVVEALINVRQHAYPSDCEFPMPHKKAWWLTGAIDFEKRHVIITTLDRGATIPRTLGDEYNKRFPITQALFQQMKGITQSPYPRDAIILANAMNYGISSTGLKHRGKGLAHMLRIVDLCNGGTFRVYSRCGKYVKEAGKDPELLSGPVPLDGTIISWTLAL